MLHSLSCVALTGAFLGQTVVAGVVTEVVVKPVEGVIKLQAASTKESAAAPGVWVATWSGVPAGLRYVSPMVWLRDERSGFETFGVSGTEPLQFERAARDLKALPKGRRAMHLWYYRDGLLNQAADRMHTLGAPTRTPWPTTAEARVKSQWNTALDGLVAAGAKPEYIFLDNEEAGLLTNWHLTASQIGAFIEDPRFDDALLSSQAASVGVATPSLAGSTFAGPQSGAGYLAWNLVVQSMANDAIGRALWLPAKNKFPNLKGSAYQSSNIAAEHASPDLNGHAQPLSNRFGTGSAPALYGWLNGAGLYCSIDPADHTKLQLGVGGTPIGRSAWMALMMDVQMGRAVRRSDSAPMQPWILSPSWSGEPEGTACYKMDPRYYDEMVRHIALLNTSVFQLWNPAEMRDGLETEVSRDRRYAEARALDAVLAGINRKLLDKPAAPVDASRLAWDASIIATGTKLGPDSFLWRVTAKPDVRAFQVGTHGRIVTIPSDAVGVWITSTRAQLPPLHVIGGDTEVVAQVAP